MNVIQIAVGQPRSVTFEKKRIETCIFKTPVSGRVRAGSLCIEGDQQSDLRVHGGRDKAIYVYSQDYYADWAKEMPGGVTEPSQFGENLTVSGCRDSEVVIGTRFRIGEIEVTVMQPRIPCYKLGLRVNDPAFPNRFWTRGRLGFYLRVNREGFIERGDEIEVLAKPAHGFTIRKLFETVVGNDRQNAATALHLLPDLDDGWQRRLRAVLKKT